MPKLTNTQSVVLSAAARRDGGIVLPLPRSLAIDKGTAARILKGLIKKGLIEERSASREAEVWREAKDGRRMTLVITETGLKAIERKPADQSRKPPAAAKPHANKPRTERKTAGAKPKGERAPPTVRRGTKQALLIDLLKRKRGATIEEIVEVTGWQPHSVRGAISGTLKKKLGLIVASEKVTGRGRVYRIPADR